MRYLDHYVRLAVKNFEIELTRVALIDAQAKIYKDSDALSILLGEIMTGEIKPPSMKFEEFAQKFMPDDKYSRWARRLYYDKQEIKLFSSCAELSNVLTTTDDIEFSAYCRRVGYVFPNGWPNDPTLYEATLKKVALERLAKSKGKSQGLFQKWIHLLRWKA